MKKRVGLVTCYINNYGACLQAYALQTSVKSLGFDCEIIQYTPVSNVKKYGFTKCIVNKIKDFIRLLRIPNYSFVLARKRKFEKFRKKHLIFSEENYPSAEYLYNRNLPYCAFITGSDQIWNPLIHNNCFDKIYMLDFVKSGVKRIAYAPSIGIASLPDEYNESMKRYLEEFDVLSTREQSGADIVCSLVSKPCCVVLDPTLLLNREKWLNIATPRLIEKQYIFCYVFSEQQYINLLIERAKDKLRIDAVIIPLKDRDFSGTDILVKSVGPLDFVSLIANASLVITDSFHATAFSINLNIPFYSCLRNIQGEKNNMNTRITSILELTGLEDRLVTNESKIPSEVNLNIDFTQSNIKLCKKRESDLCFLRTSLSENQELL